MSASHVVTAVTSTRQILFTATAHYFYSCWPCPNRPCRASLQTIVHSGYAFDCSYAPKDTSIFRLESLNFIAVKFNRSMFYFPNLYDENGYQRNAHRLFSKLQGYSSSIRSYLHLRLLAMMIFHRHFLPPLSQMKVHSVLSTPCPSSLTQSSCESQ
jgi:hypothetical protein